MYVHCVGRHIVSSSFLFLNLYIHLLKYVEKECHPFLHDSVNLYYYNDDAAFYWKKISITIWFSILFRLSDPWCLL